jgi:hypothetical protein
MSFTGGRTITTFLSALVPSHAVDVVMAGYISDSCHTKAIVADFTKRAVVIQITYWIGTITCIRILVIDTHHSFPKQTKIKHHKAKNFYKM